MRQVSLIGLVSVLALLIGGCPGGNEGGGTGGVTPTPTTPTPVASPVTPTPSPAASASPFANPLTTKQPAKPVGVTGLLQTLPPESRITQFPKGRTDPFAAIPVQPQVAVSPTNAGGATAIASARPVPALPQLPSLKVNEGTGGNRARASGPNVAPSRRPIPQATTPRTNGGRPGNAGSGNAKPGNTPATPLLPPFIPELPKLPEPTLARGIEITGVIDVGGVPKAIVKVPNEPSRYVQAGQRISNGQVLVKRIDMNRGPTPVVVLEQYGIEVAKQVGERPVEGPGQPGAPTAIIPPPPPLNPNTRSQV